MPEKVLVTSALPYANGPVHLGHLVEYLQTDIWVRWLKLSGRQVVYVCASDTHGAPIEINAAKAGKTPEAFVGEWHEHQKKIFGEFLIEFDHYYTTHSPENRKWAERIFSRLREGGHIVERPLEQWYCEKDGRFLPDRFVRGNCPNCCSADQYGDVCEVCGKAYSSSDLKNPYCAICRTPPVRRTSQHFFFQLKDFTSFLDEYTKREGALHATMRNSVRAWLKEGLQDWCVSRDGPYFGFEIPGAPGKYFYVWLDAPIGYLSSTEHFLGEERALADYWGRDSGARIVHFIGKDIVYFHALFWPAMLQGAGLRLPDRVQVHGMLTLGGEKLSKSRGRLVTGQEYLDAGLDPEHLRWFYASNLTSGPNDVALSQEEIKNRVNAELVKTLANFVVRTLTPLKKDHGGVLSEVPTDDASRALWSRAVEASRKIAEKLDAIELRDATIELVKLGFDANKYLQDRAPWSKKKQDAAGALADLSLCANVAWVIAVWMAPILPRTAQRLTAMLGGVALDPARIRAEAPPLPAGTTLGEIGHVAVPVEDEKLDRLWPKDAPASAAAAAPAGPTITFDEFQKLDLRVARVVTAERVPKADKLLKLTVDLGGQTRQVVAGVAESYAPEELIGRNVILLANLAPATIRGIESQGMILAAGEKKVLALSALDRDVPPGTKVR